jgi:outer membrane protein OmpA-like peptidoglycan-associated protein
MSETVYVERVRDESPLLWPALFLFVVAAGFYCWYWQNHRPAYPAHTNEQVMPPPAAAPAAETPSKAPVVAALGEFYMLKLPDGTELNVPRLGIESKLVAFIEDASKPADKTTWFDFDRLLFDTGKATLQPASEEQLHNIAAILKAFPKVHARIGGYTDNTGDADANLKLSDDRAKNVMNELVALGVGAPRLDSKGYGSEHPVASNATEEGRAKNRRISLRVTEK